MNTPNIRPVPRWRSRRLWEPVTLVLIALGLLMLLQPFALALYSCSFVVLLAGVLGYSVAGKLP
jgi:hypothetical protein